MIDHIKNFLSRGTWWKHLVLLTPLAYYGRHAENDVERIMLAAVGYVAYLVIEKVYEDDTHPPEHGIDVYPE